MDNRVGHEINQSMTPNTRGTRRGHLLQIQDGQVNRQCRGERPQRPQTAPFGFRGRLETESTNLLLDPPINGLREGFQTLVGMGFCLHDIYSALSRGTVAWVKGEPGIDGRQPEL